MSKYETVNINNKLVSIDLSELIKKENLFFNATEIAKQFGKEVFDFLRLDSTNRYIELIIADKLKPISNRDMLIKTIRGRNGGTWLHHEIALEFASWLSIEFRYGLHQFVSVKLQEEKQRKQSRALAKLEYPQMTLAIQEAHENPKSYHYSNEADLINRIILGTTAKKYCELNEIDRTCLRDNLTNPQIDLINHLQRLNTSMIELGMSFEERKEKLNIRYAQLVAKLLN